MYAGRGAQIASVPTDRNCEYTKTRNLKTFTRGITVPRFCSSILILQKKTAVSSNLKAPVLWDVAAGRPP